MTQIEQKIEEIKVLLQQQEGKEDEEKEQVLLLHSKIEEADENTNKVGLTVVCFMAPSRLEECFLDLLKEQPGMKQVFKRALLKSLLFN